MTTPTLHQAAQMAEDTLAALWDRHAGGKLNIDSACPAFIDRAQKTITALRAALAQSAAPAVPDGMVLVPREPTPEMLAAYLVANTKYWQKVDAKPFDATKKWRQGTPSDATRESYRAMIAASPAQAVPAPAVREPLTLSDDDLLRIATTLGMPFGMLDTDYCKSMEIEPGTRSYGEVTCDGMVRFARAAIAAAHGITGGKP